MSLNLELELAMVKCFFFYTQASKNQEFNHKMNVVNLKANMGFLNTYIYNYLFSKRPKFSQRTYIMLLTTMGGGF